MVGESIAHYKITERIGAGGMGEVYRARDTKLNREVALKVLPEQLAQDEQRMARFAREAQVLASLNHPNIGAIYGLEENALVLELIEGETLAERIERGPVELNETVSVGVQVAEAMEAAHEKGIIHRDLKPANVKITAEGTVKVLDFGLAKALEEERPSKDLADSPTLSMAATQAGIILGTAAYMSPEQASGGAVDKRTDIWSFGVLLFEMLTGRQLFQGETLSHILADVLRAELDWNKIPASTPPALVQLLKRCLDRDTRNRLRDIGEARILLAAPLEPVSETAAAGKRGLGAWLVSAVLAAALLAALWLWPADAPGQVVHVQVGIPPEVELHLQDDAPLAISPDGTRIAFLGTGDRPQMYVRKLDESTARPVAGTEDASHPFFSSDGNWIGYFANGKLKKIDAEGGPALTVCEGLPGMSNPRGASWQGDAIVFSPNTASGLFRVSAGGGTPTQLTALVEEDQERTHRWPLLLPGEEWVLFTVGTVTSTEFYDDSSIDAVNLATGERRTVFRGASFAQFVLPDYLLLARGGVLMGARLDLGSLSLIDQPVPLIEGVSGDPTSGVVYAATSETGSLLFVPGGSFRRLNLVMITPEGRRPFSAQNSYQDPAVSPQGDRIAVNVIPPGADADIWLIDLENDTRTRFTFEGNNQWPVWTWDGRHIAFTSDRDGTPGIYWKASDGSRQAEPLVRSERYIAPSSFSSDGRFLTVEVEGPESGDLLVYPLEDIENPIVFADTPHDERCAQFSPDGRWIAYTSNESGSYQAYVRPFPGPGGKWQVSPEGIDIGLEAYWSFDGSEILYEHGRVIYAVPVSGSEALQVGTPRPLYTVERLVDGFDTAFTPAPGGTVVALEIPDEEAELPRLDLILNWKSQLEKKLNP